MIKKVEIEFKEKNTVSIKLDEVEIADCAINYDLHMNKNKKILNLEIDFENTNLLIKTL